MHYSQILLDCAKIAEERGQQYGDVKENINQTVEIYQAMFGKEIKPETIIEIMIALKWARHRHKPKMDNLHDAINYTAILAQYIQ